VAGGYLGSGPGTHLVSAADLWDPATGMYSATGSMAKARDGHTTTLLPSGRVLVAGGGDWRYCRTHSCAASSSSAAEIYDAAAGRFASSGAMEAGRFFHAATLLPGGRVLITGGWGGSSSGAALASAELYA
jgi:hypothetical protein